MLRVGVIQSNYIPWKGYFDIINEVDLFIFHDDLQYTKGDWRNRNKIKSINGLKWLTIPCGTDEKRLICEVQLTDHSWQKKHWSTIKTNYSRAPYFHKYKDFFRDYYLGQKWTNLSDLNQALIQGISVNILKMDTKFEDSRKYNLKKAKAERVIELLNKCHADFYLSGPAAKDYLDASKFKNSNIGLEYMIYDYPEYPQLHGEFKHAVSVLDVLFNCGEESSDYIFGGKSEIIFNPVFK